MGFSHVEKRCLLKKTCPVFHVILVMRQPPLGMNYTTGVASIVPTPGELGVFIIEVGLEGTLRGHLVQLPCLR